jgi:voltage-gated potassium channel
MFILLRRFLGRVIAQATAITWTALLLIGLVLFGATWIGLALFEAPDAPIIQPQNFWWYWIVTATTIGYGDFAAASTGGRLTVLVFNMMGGIGLLGALIGKIAGAAYQMLRRGNLGMTSYDFLRDHAVVFGWHGKATCHVVNMIITDPKYSDDVVLVTTELKENPLPGRVSFVRGENLGDLDVLQRSGVATALTILIHGATDDQTLAAAVAVTPKARADAHIVACVNGVHHAELIANVSPRIECVRPLTDELLIRALHDPWSSRIGHEIFSNLEGQTQFSAALPADLAGRSFGEVLEHLKRRHDALVLGYAAPGRIGEVVVNPSNDTTLAAGTILYYLARERIDLA